MGVAIFLKFGKTGQNIKSSQISGLGHKQAFLARIFTKKIPKNTFKSSKILPNPQKYFKIPKKGVINPPPTSTVVVVVVVVVVAGTFAGSCSDC